MSANQKSHIIIVVIPVCPLLSFLHKERQIKIQDFIQRCQTDSCRASERNNNSIYKRWRHRWYHWKRLERRLFQLFSENLAIVLDFLILQEKQNMHILSLNIKNKFALSAKQDRKTRQMLAFLPVSKALTNKLYIFRQCTYIVYLFVHIVFTETVYDISTRNNYVYHYVINDGIDVRGHTSIAFSVMACNDAHIALSKNNGVDSSDTYEIVIGGWGDHQSVIRGTHIVDNVVMNLICRG